MNSSRSYRTIVLIFIAALHVALLAYASLASYGKKVAPPEEPRVLMAQIIPQKVVQPPAPQPVTPTPPPPKPKPQVVKTPTLTKAVPKPRVETPTPVRVAEQPAPAMAQRAEAATPTPPAPVVAPPAPTPAPAPVAAVTPPRFNAAYLNNPAPAYPPIARRMGDEGKVMLRVHVTPEGTAGEVQVSASSGSPMFDEAAIAAVKQWRFIPAKQGDSPVAAWVQVPIVFRLT